MADWLANKGAGPWAFQEQPEKLGYVNNPRWTGAPASELEHEPCGYWLKTQIPVVADGPLHATGDNQYGQLGLGYTFPSAEFSFKQVGSESDWVQIALGAYHCIALKANHTLWSTGLNSYGQLALGGGGDRSVFTHVVTGNGLSRIFCGAYGA